MVFVLVTALVAQTAPNPVLRVATDNEHSQLCPAGESLAAALRARLPSVLVVVGGALSGDDLAVAVSPSGEGWSLDVRRADGSPALHRDLRGGPTACGEVADTAALIVERYLVDIEWPGRPVALSPLQKESATETPPPGISFDVEAGLAARFGMWPGDPEPGAVGEIGVTLADTLRLSLWGEWSPARSISFAVGGNSPVSGTLTLQTLLALLSISYCGALGPTQGCVGPLAGASVFRGSAHGNVYRPQTATELLAALGASGRITFPIPFKFGITLEAAAIAPLGTDEFQVEDYPSAPHLQSSAIQVMASVRLLKIF